MRQASVASPLIIQKTTFFLDLAFGKGNGFADVDFHSSRPSTAAKDGLSY